MLCMQVGSSLCHKQSFIAYPGANKIDFYHDRPHRYQCSLQDAPTTLLSYQLLLKQSLTFCVFRLRTTSSTWCWNGFSPCKRRQQVPPSGVSALSYSCTAWIVTVGPRCWWDNFRRLFFYVWLLDEARWPPSRTAVTHWSQRHDWAEIIELRDCK